MIKGKKVIQRDIFGSRPMAGVLKEIILSTYATWSDGLFCSRRKFEVRTVTQLGINLHRRLCIVTPFVAATCCWGSSWPGLCLVVTSSRLYGSVCISFAASADDSCFLSSSCSSRAAEQRVIVVWLSPADVHCCWLS